jgi:hypothetical protein
MCQTRNSSVCSPFKEDAKSFENFADFFIFVAPLRKIYACAHYADPQRYEKNKMKKKK